MQTFHCYTLLVIRDVLKKYNFSCMPLGWVCFWLPLVSPFPYSINVNVDSVFPTIKKWNLSLMEGKPIHIGVFSTKSLALLFLSSQTRLKGKEVVKLINSVYLSNCQYTVIQLCSKFLCWKGRGKGGVLITWQDQMIRLESLWITIHWLLNWPLFSIEV